MWKRGLFQLLVMPLPWRLRRWLLETVLGYGIHPSARIGMSVVMPRVTFTMRAGSLIGHLNLIRGMDALIMEPKTLIGHLNWIYAIPASDPRLSHEPARRAELLLDRGAHVTSRHTIDCSNTIRLGPGSAVVGYRTQMLTHGLSTAKIPGVHTKPIDIGSNALVATGCIVLGGSRLPSHSALGAGSTLRNSFSAPYGLYSGVPAKLVATIPEDSPFFIRDGGDGKLPD